MRTLHLLDIENLAGGGRLRPDEAARAVGRFQEAIRVGPCDPLIVACGPTSVLAAGSAVRHSRLLIGRGVDGADLRLLEVLATDPIVERVDEIVLGSGDGIFAPIVADLEAAGCPVTIASHRDRLSRRLALAASRTVTWIDALPLERRAA